MEGFSHFGDIEENCPPSSCSHGSGLLKTAGRLDRLIVWRFVKNHRQDAAVLFDSSSSRFQLPLNQDTLHNSGFILCGKRSSGWCYASSG